MQPPPADDEQPAPESRLRLRTWRDRQVVAVALVSVASGYGQFGAVAALGDVAKALGHITHGATIAEQAGLSGTALGIGLAVIRLASLGALPLTGMADRLGRRATLLVTAAIGLGLTAVAALSPSYWFFVAIFALGRPLLSTTNALAQVNVAEQTGRADRSKAVALVTAGYGVGAGLTAIIHSLWQHAVGFRILFASALVPLVLLVVVRRFVEESDRYVTTSNLSLLHEVPVLGVVASGLRRRLGVVAAVTFFIAVIAGPATSFVFLYAENVVRQSGVLTAAMVVAAGAAGLGGLLAGRYLADRLGRRPSIVLGVAMLSGFSVLTYSGSGGLLFAGYVLGVLGGSVLAPGLGAFVNELFPTSVRASVAGWCVAASVIGAVVGLLSFGELVDVGNSFSFAAGVIFLPAFLPALLCFAAPETKGREPEQLASAGAPGQLGAGPP
ncbi:MAG: MFS transporter [Actinomycetota bacterium]|nr:MFS transporter [Actinomycetota bacterium]